MDERLVHRRDLRRRIFERHQVLRGQIRRALSVVTGGAARRKPRWCPWPESNRHSLRNSILSRARLPIPPQGHARPASEGGGGPQQPAPALSQAKTSAFTPPFGSGPYLFGPLVPSRHMKTSTTRASATKARLKMVDRPPPTEPRTTAFTMSRRMSPPNHQPLRSVSWSRR